MKTRQPQEAERDRIVEAFIGVVAERGYRATSLEPVLARAEVDEEAFRRHFADEKACFRAAWEFVSARYMPNAVGAFESATGWRWQMRALSHAILDYLTEHPDHARILFAEGPTPDEPVRTPLDPNVEVFVGLIDRGRLEMDDPDAVTRATAEGLAGAANERIALAIRRNADHELPQLLPQLMFLIVRPYLGDEVAGEELRQEVD